MARMRGIPHQRESWKQFAVGLGIMLPWPIGAAVLQPLRDPSDYAIYFVGLFWDLLWDPVAKLQSVLSYPINNLITILIVGMFVVMWLTIAVIPLFGRWPRREIIGLWALQCAYAGSQAIAGYFYAKSFLV